MLRRLLVCAALLAAVTPPALAQWYAVKSDLHRKSGAAWKAASQAQRLSTAGDFYSAAMGKDEVLRRYSTMDQVKVPAFALMNCIDEAVAGSVGDAIKVSEAGAGCIVILEARGVAGFKRG